MHEVHHNDKSVIILEGVFDRDYILVIPQFVHHADLAEGLPAYLITVDHSFFEDFQSHFLLFDAIEGRENTAQLIAITIA